MDKYPRLIIQILTATLPSIWANQAYAWPLFKALRATNRAFNDHLGPKLLTSLFVNDYSRNNVSLLKFASRHDVLLGLTTAQLKFIDWPYIYLCIRNRHETFGLMHTLGGVTSSCVTWAPNIPLEGHIAALQAPYGPLIAQWSAKENNHYLQDETLDNLRVFYVYKKPVNNQLLENIRILIAHHYQDRTNGEINKMFRALYVCADCDMEPLLRELCPCYPSTAIDAFVYYIYLKHRNDAPKLLKMITITYGKLRENLYEYLEATYGGMIDEMFIGSALNAPDSSSKDHLLVFKLENKLADGILTKCLNDDDYRPSIAQYLADNGLNNILAAYKGPIHVIFFPSANNKKMNRLIII
jgi:hypothetical protein